MRTDPEEEGMEDEDKDDAVGKEGVRNRWGGGGV